MAYEEELRAMLSRPNRPAVIGLECFQMVNLYGDGGVNAVSQRLVPFRRSGLNRSGRSAPILRCAIPELEDGSVTGSHRPSWSNPRVLWSKPSVRRRVRKHRPGSLHPAGPLRAGFHRVTLHFGRGEEYVCRASRRVRSRASRGQRRMGQIRPRR